MTKEETLFNQIGMDIPNSTKGHLFGKPCFKSGKKAYICFFQNEIVCKLSGEDHSDALSLDGSKLFDPSGKGRPMKEWVQISYDYKDLWKKFALGAFA